VEALSLFDGLGDELNVAIMLARIVTIAREDQEPEVLALLAGAASALLEQQRSRGLSDTPQVAEAIHCVTGLGVEQTAEWLRGQTATRAAAVAAARRLVADRAGAI
jgi:hypothetical protein